MKKLNKDVQDKALALNRWILSQEVVQEYQRYEHLIQSQTDLCDWEAYLKQLQQAIVQKKHRGEDCQELVENYQYQKQHFDENPIVYNYLFFKNEVNELINQIQNEINLELQKKS